MQPFLLLKKWQFRMMRNNWRLDRARLIKQTIQLAFLGLLLVFLYFGALSLFRSFAQAAETLMPGVLPNLQLQFLSSVAMGMFVFFIMTGLRIINTTLFEAGDLSFLLAQPIPTRSVFASKVLDSYVTSMSYMVPLALSVWIAFGVANTAPLAYYALAIAIGLFGTLLFHSAIVILVLIIMRFVPGQTMKQLFMALSALGGLVIVLGSQLFTSRGMQDITQDPVALLETIGQWGLGNVKYMPHVWMAKALVLPFPEYNVTWAESFVPLILATCAMAGLSIVLADRLYAQGWGSASVSSISKRRGARPRRGHRQARRGPFWAMIRKDLAMFRRDPLLWYHFLINAIVVGFFFYNFSGGRPVSNPSPAILITPILMSAVSSIQLGGLGISREGSNFLLLRIHLTEPKALYWSKLVLSALPSVIFLTVTALVLEFLPNFAPYPLPVTLVLVWAIGISMAAVQILLDILNPDFNLKIELGSNRKNNVGAGRLMLSMGAVILQLIVALILFAVPQVLLRHTPLLALTVSLLALVVWTALTITVSYTWGAKRLEQLLLQDHL